MPFLSTTAEFPGFSCVSLLQGAAMFPHAAGKFGSPEDAQTSPGSRLETFSAVAILKNSQL